MSQRPSGQNDPAVLAAKHIGTGNPDITRHTWLQNQHRDTLASHVGSRDHLAFLAVGRNVAVGRVRAECLEAMLQPVGPRPDKVEE